MVFQLEIKPGEMIAITGASGAGKTTLLRLIAGLYPPTLGAVLVDDMDLRQIDPTEWRSQIAFLPETANFFYGTLAQNIRLSRPDASDAEVVGVLKEMGLDSEEQLTSEGIHRRLTAADLDSFSDALKQRLALARCFIKDAPALFAGQPRGFPRHGVRTAFAQEVCGAEGPCDGSIYDVPPEPDAASRPRDHAEGWTNIPGRSAG